MDTRRLKALSRRNPIVKGVLYPAVAVRRKWLKRKALVEDAVLRNLADLVTNDLVVRVEGFDGVFDVDVHSDVFRRLVKYKCYEPELARCCTKHLDPGKDAIDVGANVGFFTVMFAKRLHEGRKVLAVEPTANALKRLRRNIELNGVTGNVVVFEGVASDRNGDRELKIVRGREEYSSLGVMAHHSIEGAEFVSETVSSLTLDDLVKRHSIHPGFIKIDAEGSEHLVFEGARNVMQTERPIIVSELSDFLLKKNGSASREVIEKIERCEYDVIDPIDPTARPGESDFEDILCAPRELNIRNSR